MYLEIFWRFSLNGMAQPFWLKSEDQPLAKGIAAKRLALTGFLRGL
jgi:hypothetical protein